jgi:hypothetical protein
LEVDFIVDNGLKGKLVAVRHKPLLSTDGIVYFMAFAPRHLSRNLDGDLTELLVQTYADRVMVLVTQLGKVGTLVPLTCWIHYLANLTNALI